MRFLTYLEVSNLNDCAEKIVNILLCSSQFIGFDESREIKYFSHHPNLSELMENLFNFEGIL